MKIYYKGKRISGEFKNRKIITKIKKPELIAKYFVLGKSKLGQDKLK